MQHVRTIHADSRGTYGSSRLPAALTLGLGMPVNGKRVARLLRAAGIQGLSRRRRRGCPVRHPAGPPAADRAGGQCTVDAPNRLWITGSTEHPTTDGRVCCAAVSDAYARRIVGWSSADHLRTALVTAALGLAILRRQPGKHPTAEPAIPHSEHGAQYTSWAFGQRLSGAGLVASMGTVGDGDDNAMIESFWGTLHLELLDSRQWQTVAGGCRVAEVSCADLYRDQEPADVGCRVPPDA